MSVCENGVWSLERLAQHGVGKIGTGAKRRFCAELGVSPLGPEKRITERLEKAVAARLSLTRASEMDLRKWDKRDLVELVRQLRLDDVRSKGEAVQRLLQWRDGPSPYVSLAQTDRL